MSISAATVSRPEIAVGSMRWPRRYWADGLVMRFLYRAGRAWSAVMRAIVIDRLLGARLDHDARGLRGIVGDAEQQQVGRIDLALLGDGAGEPVHQPRPVRAAEQYHREVLHLSGLDQRERLEQLVERAVPAGEDDERGGVLHEHRLANEEELEVEAPAQVRVRALLERQLDVAADREPAALHRAPVGRLHDARAAARDAPGMPAWASSMAVCTALT